jgi:flavin-dependent dehydrogenase
LVGDAFAFLDPVFSSGVFFALKSGEMAADAVHQALEKGDVSASQFQHYGEKMCDGVELMRKIVYAFYDESFSFGKLVRKYPDLRPDLTDCLIGNLEKHDFRELVEAMKDFARVPSELEYGRSGYTEATALPKV